MTNYELELMAGELRRRAAKIVPNPQDCSVYVLAEELAAEGHESTRSVPAAELAARIRANTLPEGDGDRDDETTAECWQWYESVPANVPTLRPQISVYAPAAPDADTATPAGAVAA